MVHAAPSAMPSVQEIIQVQQDEATGMDIDTVISEVAQARSGGHMNPMVGAPPPPRPQTHSAKMRVLAVHDGIALNTGFESDFPTSFPAR
jgi:hypothetical protein